MRPHYILFIVISTFLNLSLCSQEIVDVGIFEAVNSDTFYIKARPTYTIDGLSMTNAQLTIRWEETSGVSSLNWLGTTIGLLPQGTPIIANGYYYLVYASFGGGSLNWNEGEEYLILTIAPDNMNFNCATFEIALDDWTAANNGDYYFEVIGENRTGIRYEPYLNYGSEGGYVDGDTSIYLGAGTGILSLEEYKGNILTWQRNQDQGGWLDIPGTAGMTTYEEIPSPDGTYQYRAEVQLGSCPPVNSLPASVTVELLAVWSGEEDTLWDNFNNWNVVGVPDLYTDALIPLVISDQYPVVPSEAFVKRLTIDSGASLTIAPAGEITLAGDLVNDGTMTLQAEEDGTGSLVNDGEIYGSGTFTSQIAYQSYEYHLASSPVMGETAGAFPGLDLHRWLESSGNWVPITDPGDTLTVFTGYRLESSTPGLQITSFTGQAYNSGIYVKNLTNNGLPNTHRGGFNLTGNPYPSAVNWNTSNGWVRNQVDPAIYIYNGNAGNYGTYLLNDPASSTLGVDSIIASGQGFFVHVGHEFSSGDLVVNNNARLHEHRNINRIAMGRSPEPLVRIKIYMDPESSSDEVVVRFREGATTDFDVDKDIYDFPGREDAPMLFTRGQDTLRLAVNTYPELVVNTSIPMGFYPGQDGNFILKVEEMANFGPDTLIFLEDLKENTIHQLTEYQELEIISSITDDINRFILKFQVEPVGVPEKLDRKNFSAYFSGNQIYLKSGNDHPLGNIQLINLTGHHLLDRNISDSECIIHLFVRPGVYIIRRFSMAGNSSVKLVKSY